MQAVVPKIRGVSYNNDASYLYADSAVLTTAQQGSESRRENPGMLNVNPR